MMTRNHAWYVVGVALLLVAAIGITWNVAQLVGHVTAAPTIDLGVLPAVAVLLVFPAFVAGQLHRGVSHGRGIIRSHLAAVAGKGLALLLLVVAIYLVAGGA